MQVSRKFRILVLTKAASPSILLAEKFTGEIGLLLRVGVECEDCIFVSDAHKILSEQPPMDLIVCDYVVADGSAATILIKAHQDNPQVKAVIFFHNEGEAAAAAEMVQRLDIRAEILADSFTDVDEVWVKARGLLGYSR